MATEDSTQSANSLNDSISGEGARAPSRGRGTHSMDREEEVVEERAGTAASTSSDTGAPPSNTAPYDDINVKILRTGIDSIYYSYAGTMRDIVEVQLSDLKTKAQSLSDEDRADANILLADHPFSVSPKGRGRFPYAIKDNWYHLSLSGANNKKLPLAYVQVGSELLTRAGLDRATGTLNLLMEMISGEIKEPSVSRVDLCVDFVLNDDLGRIPSDHFVFLADAMNLHHCMGELTGYQFGKRGRVNARLYDKTLEIKQQSHKDYLYPIWEEQGWDGKSKVWRLEFELRKDFLKDYGINDRNDLVDHLESLWQYCTTTWLQVKRPNPNDSRKDRWPLYPWWADIQDVCFEDSGKEQIYRVPKNTSPSDQYLFVNGLGAITTFMAINSIHSVNEGIREYFEAARQYHSGRTRNHKHAFEIYVLDKVHVKQATMSVVQTWQEHASLTGEDDEL